MPNQAGPTNGLGRKTGITIGHEAKKSKRGLEFTLREGNVEEKNGEEKEFCFLN